MQLFYTPDINSNIDTLNEIESKHCVRVLRKKEGDLINLIDGRGGFYEAEITDANSKQCVISIVKYTKEFNKRNYELQIAVAPTKSNDRFEWFLEKATEIGVDTVIPILCQFSERKQIKPERFNKIIISAIKQSLKAFCPNLLPMLKFSDLIKQ